MKEPSVCEEYRLLNVFLRLKNFHVNSSRITEKLCVISLIMLRKMCEIGLEKFRKMCYTMFDKVEEVIL